MKKNAVFSLASVVLTSAIATAISCTVIASEDEHREHGAHEHGKAQINVIVEKSELAIMLETPAMNIFGFEHEPKNDAQKQAVELAIKDLENISSLIKTDKGAACKIVNIDVDQPFEDHEHDEKDDHDEKHEEGHAKEHDGHDDHDEHEESAHSDVDIEIAYNCENASKLTQLDLGEFFKRFPGFADIDAQIIVNGQQSAAELTKEHTILELKM